MELRQKLVLWIRLGTTTLIVFTMTNAWLFLKSLWLRGNRTRLGFLNVKVNTMVYALFATAFLCFFAWKVQKQSWNQPKPSSTPAHQLKKLITLKNDTNTNMAFRALNGYWTPYGVVQRADGETRITSRVRSQDERSVGFGTWYFDRPWPLHFNDCRHRCRYEPDYTRAEAVIFNEGDLYMVASLPQLLHRIPRNKDQYWVLHTMEPPTLYSWWDHKPLDGVFNITMSYRRNSEVHTAYGYTVRKKRRQTISDEKEDWRKAVGRRYLSKTRMALVVSSNCGPVQSRRWEVVKALQRHGIVVDVHGACGAEGPQCHDGGRSRLCGFTERATVKRWLRPYMFYLSFENARCSDYFTEKIWLWGLKGGAIPVVLGGKSKADYTAALPPNSFIYAPDYGSTARLAAHLIRVAQDVDLFEGYFAWQNDYEVQHEYYDCKLCEYLHNEFYNYKIPQFPQRIENRLGWTVEKECVKTVSKDPLGHKDSIEG